MSATDQSSQPSAELENFRHRVLAEPALLEELRRTRDTTEFINASIQAAQKMGIVFTPADVENSAKRGAIAFYR